MRQVTSLAELRAAFKAGEPAIFPVGDAAYLLYPGTRRRPGLLLALHHGGGDRWAWAPRPVRAADLTDARFWVHIAEAEALLGPGHLAAGT